MKLKKLMKVLTMEIAPERSARHDFRMLLFWIIVMLLFAIATK